MDAGLILEISDEEFGLISGLVHSRLGIHLPESKRALVAGRLQFFLREKGYPDFRAYYEGVLKDSSGRELGELADRITTNHTFFNRESDHFEFFQNVALPEIIAESRKTGRRSLKVWCAASSTGEEAYMLAMLMMDTLGVDYSNWDAGVLATDISDKALQEAKAGIYSAERIASLPAQFRLRYFRQTPEGEWQAHSRLRAEITFRRFNLIQPDFPFQGAFDVIFCRNVMIYFDAPTKESLIEKMYRFTRPGGYFFVGHSESLDRKTNPYRYVRPSIYSRPRIQGAPL